jgi:hypothetical protein
MHLRLKSRLAALLAVTVTTVVVLVALTLAGSREIRVSATAPTGSGGPSIHAVFVLPQMSAV